MDKYKEFNREMDWVTTFFHWGKSFIWKYYQIGEFPDLFIFNNLLTIFKSCNKSVGNLTFNCSVSISKPPVL